METKDIESKGLYLAKSDDKTYWFNTKSDRDYFASGGDCTFKPGRDLGNMWFDKRAVPLERQEKMPVVNTESHVSAESSSTTMSVAKERLLQLIDELKEIANVL